MVHVPGWVHRAAGGWPGRARGPITFRPAPGRVTGRPFSTTHRAEWVSPVGTATIGSAGTATIVLAPAGGQVWYPHEVSVTCNANPLYQVYVQIYRGGANGVGVSLLGTSFSGSSDTISLGGRAVRQGDALIVAISRGHPGDQVAAQFEGEQDAAA